MTDVYLSLGTNLGDRVAYLKKAVAKISSLEGLNLVKESKIYETAPWGKLDQPNFLNICLKISTSLESGDLLKNLQKIELDLGRERKERWGPRTIDIDILLFGDIISQDPNLILPHPRMKERAFVLIPLLEIEPELKIIDDRVKDILEKLDSSEIKEYANEIHDI